MPSYDELPPAPLGGRSAWGLFGAEDNLGLINLLTPERIAAAAKLIERGTLFPLDTPVDAFSPPLAPERGVPQHRLIHKHGGFSFDDAFDNLHPQGASQWDALAHIGYAADTFYNGASEQDIIAGKRLAIDHWARHGIAGRLVLLDMVRTFAELSRPYDPGSNSAFSVEDLELARRRSGVEFQTGDILLIHTGFVAWYLGLSTDARAEAAAKGHSPGIVQGEEMCRYLWNTHVCAVASDTFAVEAMPPPGGAPLEFIHRILIGQFGLALGELWWTEDLAADCAEDGRYAMFLSSAPLNAPGGIGSPANAIAIK